MERRLIASTGVSLDIRPVAAEVGRPAIDLVHSSVSLGGATDSSQEDYLASTTGSRSWLWKVADEMRFEKATGRLAGLRLRIPGERERMQCPSDFLRAELRYRGPEFSLKPASFCDFDVKSGALIASSRAPVEGSADQCIEVARGLGLLCSRWRIVGWILWPIEESLIVRGADAGVARELFSAFIELSSDASLELLEAGDSQVLAAVTGAFRAATEAGEKSLASGFRRLLDDFAPQS